MSLINRCWAEVSLDNLLNNYNLIKSGTGAQVMCVVKANAYGHGDTNVVRALEQAGATNFAVASMNEAVHIRKMGCTGNILILGGCIEQHIPYAAEHNIILTVHDIDFANQISNYAQKTNTTINVHIKINTGMNRIGFNLSTNDQLDACVKNIQSITSLKGVNVVGAFTHFCQSDEQLGADFTAEQFSRFMLLKSKLEQNGTTIKNWHCANSGAIINYPNMHLDFVRAGIMLYGIYDGFGKNDSFKPVLSLKSVITQIHNVCKNDSISYGRTYTADSDVCTATVSIGYADGLPRSLSNCGYVLVSGKMAKILGRVCMDQIVIDITNIDCKVGDTVTVIGTDGKYSITASDIAKADGTINYEILCRIAQRVPRVYIKDQKTVDITEYI